MTGTTETYEAPTSGTWAEYDKSVGKVGAWLHGHRYWTVQTDAGWVGVVDGRGVTDPAASSALAQRGAVQHIVEHRKAPRPAPVRVVRRGTPLHSMRTCAYCGRRLGAQSMCCGDFA